MHEKTALEIADDLMAEATMAANRANASSDDYDVSTTVRIAASTLRSQYNRIAELEAELVAEAKKTASEKLRAEQMTEQHRMQAKMHKAAAEALGKVLSAVQRYLPPDGPSDGETLNEIIGIVDPWPIPVDSSEPKPASTPWYPDDSGEWVEVPDDLRNMPSELASYDVIVVLLWHERKYQRGYSPYRKGAAGSWYWKNGRNRDGRIVAYKVVKP